MAQQLRNRLRECLRPRTTATAVVEISPDAFRVVPRVMEERSLWRRVLLVGDERTLAAAGGPLETALAGAGIPLARLVLDAAVPTDACAEQVAAAIRGRPRVTPIAVGAGTINDTVKLACEWVHTPYIAVATAPSMNGYPSPISAVLREGLKCTVPAQPPVAIIYDLETMRAAPRPMVGAGYADLLAKPTSVSDWILARELAGEPFQREPLRILEGVTESVVRHAEGIREPSEVGMETLCIGLTLSGLSMAMAGTSQPASGAEHLVSHFWDMIGHRDGTPTDLHGRQVGVGTILLAGLFERLLALGADEIAAAPDAADWPALEAGVREAYGSLAQAALPELRHKTRDQARVEARVASARERWGGLRTEIAAVTVPAATIRDQLARGGAPTTLAEIGRTREESRSALLWARALRRRYTSLDFAAELGRLEGWVDELLDLVS